MSKYTHEPMSFHGLKTIPIQTRGGKVRVEHFGRPYTGGGVAGFLDSLPHILAADSFRSVVDALVNARARKKMILWGLGGHVIKCGLAPVLIDLMRRGYATAFAMNGAAAIHDFEIAIAGHTSEDVEAVLPDGSFGAAEETGREISLTGTQDGRPVVGYGEALGRRLEELQPQFAEYSLLSQTYRSAVPVTVHVAIGTDTPHTYSGADGAVIGSHSHHDFRLLCSLVKEINDGGVYLNVGSAVVLPEVFLKAVSVVRNLGNPLSNFTTVNFDFLQHYRPKLNVVERPHAGAGGHGYSITGHHEIMIPLLAAALIELPLMIPEPDLSPQPTTYRPPPFWHYFDLFLFISLLFASFGGLLFVAILLRFTNLSMGWKLILPQLAFYAMALTSLAAILRFRYDQPLWRSLGWKPTSLWITLSSLLAGPILAIAVGLLGVALKTPQIDLPFQQMLGTPGSVLLLGIVVVILGPVCEELAFRGFLMPLLVRSLGAAGGIVATGFIFGCMHGYEYEWSWRHMLLISLVGSVFGWAKHRTQSTAAAAFMHSTFNLAQFAAFLWQIRPLHS